VRREDFNAKAPRRQGAARQAATKDLEQERTEKTERKNFANNAPLVDKESETVRKMGSEK
jgi:hypothetical protein